MWAVVAAALLVASAAWAQPSRVGCGPAAAACGPAAVGVPGAAPTGPPAPSWVSTTLAAWMLEEASGPRVNAQGVTTRNLVETGGTAANNTVNFQQGVAALQMPASAVTLESSDTGLLLGLPYTCAMWVRPTALPGLHAMVFMSRDVNGTYGRGMSLEFSFNSQFEVRETNGASTSALTQSTTSALNVWHHVAYRHDSGANCALYLDGLSAISSASCSTFTQAVAGITRLGGQTPGIGSMVNLTGQVDEVACWSGYWSASTVCRLCSCGVDGTLCQCSGVAFANKGRNATACGACTLPADCSAAAPS